MYVWRLGLKALVDTLPVNTELKAARERFALNRETGSGFFFIFP